MSDRNLFTSVKAEISSLAFISAFIFSLSFTTVSHAEILLNNSTTTLQANTTTTYSYQAYPNTYRQNYGTENNRYSTSGNIDRLGDLIEQKNKEYEATADAFYNSQKNAHTHSYDFNNYYKFNDNLYDRGSYSSDYESWISNDYNRRQAEAYKKYLSDRVGSSNVPPMSQMLLTARSWRKCGASPYEVPPNYLWANMAYTLSLLTDLKRQGILPQNTMIRSTYRNTYLNRCAGGAEGSGHKVNSALDLWLPEFTYDTWLKKDIQNKLCDFWLYQGMKYNFGLGLYPSGAIHIDTNGYRKWGLNHSSSSSPCRY